MKLASFIKRSSIGLRIAATALVVAGCLLLAACGRGSGPDYAFIPPANPDQAHHGKTYSEWGAAWWQWAFSLPATNHPLFDQTGADAERGQHGDVWFLAATFGDPTSVARNITVPLGTAFFFPLVNFEEDSFFAPELSVTQMQEEIASFAEGVTNLHLSVDGEVVSGLENLRAISPPFSVNPPPSDDLYSFFGASDVPDIVDTMVSDGFWAFIEPLPAGEHTIIFGATDIDDIQATYHVTVE